MNVPEVTIPSPFWKRWLDIIGAILALPCLFLVVLLAAVLIRSRSAGPLLFRQVRIGYKGKPFAMLKIRTMRNCADADVHARHFQTIFSSDIPLRKLDDSGDSRIVTGSRFLRATGLDELPQVINVLKGEMSLVGPRPCLPYEFEAYMSKGAERFSTKPGITGLWQVSGKNRTTFSQMIHFDAAYLRQVSLVTDLWILLRTVPTVVEQAVRLYYPAARSASSSSPEQMIPTLDAPERISSGAQVV